MALGSSAAPTARRTALVAVGLALAVAGCSAGQLAQTANQQPTVGGANGQVGSIALRNIALAYPESGRYQQGDSARLEFIAVNLADDADTLVEIRTEVAGSVRFEPAAAGTASGSTAGTPTGGAGGSATASSPLPVPPATGTAGGTGSASPSAAPPTATATSTGTPTGTAGGTGTATGSGSPTATATPATPTATSPAAAAPVSLAAESATSFRTDGVTVTLADLTRALLPSEVVPITFVFQHAGEITLQVPVAVPLSPLPPAPTVDVDLGGETSTG